MHRSLSRATWKPLRLLRQGTGSIKIPGAQGVDVVCSVPDLSLELQNKFRQASGPFGASKG